MFKLAPESTCVVEADVLPAPAGSLRVSNPAPDELLVETDLSTGRLVTDAEIEAIVRLLGDDLARLLDQAQSH